MVRLLTTFALSAIALATTPFQPGRIQIGDLNVFYIYEPSDSNVLIVYVGGTCSAGLNFLAGFGGLRSTPDGKIYNNPYAWNKFAHIVHVDLPDGVGFTTAREGMPRLTDAEVGTHIATFVRMFRQQNRALPKDLTVYLAGDGYVGHYAPAAIAADPSAFHGSILAHPLTDVDSFSKVAVDTFTASGVLDPALQNVSDCGAAVVAMSIGVELPTPSHCATTIYRALQRQPVLAGLAASLYLDACGARSAPTPDGAVDPCAITNAAYLLGSRAGQTLLKVIEPGQPALPYVSCSQDNFNRVHAEDIKRSYKRAYGPAAVAAHRAAVVAAANASGAPAVAAPKMRHLLYAGNSGLLPPFTDLTEWVSSVAPVVPPVEKNEWYTIYYNTSLCQLAGYAAVHSGGITIASIRGSGISVSLEQPARLYRAVQLWVGGDATLGGVNAPTIPTECGPEPGDAVARAAATAMAARAHAVADDEIARAVAAAADATGVRDVTNPFVDPFGAIGGTARGGVAARAAYAAAVVGAAAKGGATVHAGGRLGAAPTPVQLPDSIPIPNEQYTGYVHVGGTAGKDGRHIFYWLTEADASAARRAAGGAASKPFHEDADDDTPVLLWLQGGPGCSGMIGIFHEFGPLRAVGDGAKTALVSREVAWTSFAHVVAIESPVCVGFSYVEGDQTICAHLNDTITAADSLNFVVGFLAQFPALAKRKFYIAGESYAGHYVPQLAVAVLDYNAATPAQRASMLAGDAAATFVKGSVAAPRIHLAGAIDGNPVTDIDVGPVNDLVKWIATPILPTRVSAGVAKHCTAAMMSGFQAGPCNMGSCSEKEKEIYGISDACWEWIRHVTPVQGLPGNIDFSNPNTDQCPVARPDHQNTARTPFDPCGITSLQGYLRRADVQKAIGAKTRAGSEWDICDDDVNLGYSFNDTFANMVPLWERIAREASVFIFSGDLDEIVSMLGTARWTTAVLDKMGAIARMPWYVPTNDVQIAGWLRMTDKFAFATVRNAGHTVPSYQPVRAVELLSNYVAGSLPKLVKGKVAKFVVYPFPGAPMSVEVCADGAC